MKRIILTTFCLLLISSTVMAGRYTHRTHGRHYDSHSTRHGGYYYCYTCNISHPYGYSHYSAPHDHHTRTIDRAIISEQIEIVE